MNKDASTFSLEAVAKTLKPSLQFFACGRVRSCLQYDDHVITIQGVQYHFKLWNSAILIPLGYEHDWKALTFKVDSRMPGYKGYDKPKRVEMDRLVLLYPSESILWAFQRTIFVPERGTDTYFIGRSTVYHINDENYSQLIPPSLNFVPKFWDQVDQLAIKSRVTREIGEVMLNGLQDKIKKRDIPK